MKASGKAWAAKAKCYATALASSSDVDQGCLDTAQAKYDDAFTKIEQAGGCSITSNAASIRTKLDNGVEDVAGDLGCGNGHLDGDEACDDGNLVANDGCSPTCTNECGDGQVTGSEQCDDGNLVNGDGCDNNCTTTACGNGIVTAGEVCDDGNAVNGDGCDNNCTVSACGNGALAPSEACDDGNIADGDGCSSTCTLETTCPCWTTASLDGLYPIGYFDQAGRGGVFCYNGGIYNLQMVSNDSCNTGPPANDDLARAGFGVSNQSCVILSDQDPSNSGFCPAWSQTVNMGPMTTIQNVACYWTMKKTAIVQATCP
jgi:cysteine-rich repeat protein